MNNDIRLQADPEFSYSINVQIKEQLKWLIGIGAIRPGELLPPAGQLADALQVNRNTVNLVYAQLREEGLVSGKKGRGTQVLAGPAVETLIRKRQAMRELLSRTMQEAEESGISPDELALAGLAFARLFGKPAAADGKRKLLFVECRGHDHPFYREQVEKEAQAEVSVLFLEEIAGRANVLAEAAGRADAVVTTLNHADEVRGLLEGVNVPLLTIGAAASPPVLLEIARMEAGSRIAFVCLGRQGGQWMADRVAEAGLTHIASDVAGTDNREALRKIVRQADRVYASSAAYDELRSLAPDKAALYPLVLERSSEKLLRDLSLEP